MTLAMTSMTSCTRCGNFVARLVPGYKVCEPCLAHLLPQGVRGETNLSSLASGVAHVLRTVGLQSVLMLGVVNVPVGLITLLRRHEPTQGLGSLGALLWSPFPFFTGLVVMVLAHQSLRGMPISLRSAAARAASRFLTVFWTNVVSVFFAMLWSLLLVIPGVHKTLCYCLAAHIALFESQSGDDAVASSMHRTAPVLGTLYFLGIAAVVFSAVFQGGAALVATGLVGAVQVEPDAQMLTIAFAVALGVTTVSSTLLSLLTLTTLQVLYEQSAIQAANAGLLVVDDDA